MKLINISFPIILFLTFFSVQSESQEIKWGIMLGSDKEEYVLNHVVDNDGNIYIPGKTKGDIGGKNQGQNDGFLIKLDGAGKELWAVQFGSEGDEDIQWSALDGSGNIYITGFTTGKVDGKNSGKEDVLIVKYTPDGKLAWKKQIGTDSTDIAKGICADSNGYIYVTGMTAGRLGQVSNGKSDCFIIKLDQDGNIIKTVQFGTEKDDLCYSVIPGINDGIFVCGTTWGDFEGKNHGVVDGFTGYFSSDLELRGFHQFGSDGFDIPLVLKADGKNDIFVAGTTSGDFASPQAGAGDCFVLRMDQKGEIIWKRQFGTDQNDGARGIDINDAVSDKVFISGIINLPPEKAFIRVYSKDGDVLFERILEALGFTGGTSGKDIHLDRKGNITHIGLTKVPLFGQVIGGNDVYIIKMEAKKFLLK